MYVKIKENCPYCTIVIECNLYLGSNHTIGEEHKELVTCKSTAGDFGCGRLMLLDLKLVTEYGLFKIEGQQ